MSVTSIDEKEWRSDKAAFASILSSFILCFLSLGIMLWLAGPWDVIAQTRVLSLLIDAGVIPLSEDDPGLGDGVPRIRLWTQSQEPIIWWIVIFAALLFLAVSVLKSLQFHYILRSQGVPGTAGEHFKSYLFGNALGRLLPFRTGEAAWAASLMEKHKGSAEQISRSISVFKEFTILELATFSLISLLLMDVFMWGFSLATAFAILLICWLATKGSSHEELPISGRLAKVFNSLASMATNPQLLTRLIFLSLFSFFLVEFASYIVPQAFATVVVRILSNELGYVILTPSILIMSVIGGYIARLVKITPGGIGQFEWGMALVMTVNGLPFTHAVSVTLLICAVRYLTGALLFIGLLLGYGAQASMREVFGLMQPK